MATPTTSDYLNRISREYGMYVLDSRAIPAMTDGLKSGQRISLWLLRNRAEKIKTIALAGQMIASELYVHGDAAASDAISMLAGPYCNNHPLIKGLGAFGTRANPTSFAAPRYTSVKRSKIAQDVLYVDLDIVPMVENHDGSNMMPATFLPLLPLVLLNGIKGIAPGWSTNILPRKLSDLVRAVQEVLQHGSVQTPLMPCYENRDVTIVRDDADPNKYIIKGKVDRKNTTTIIVTELPPDLSLEAFRERLSTMEEDGKISGFTDRSTKTINVEVKMRRDALAKLNTDAKLIEFLKIRTLTTENMTVQGIGGSNIRQYGSAEELVKDWVEWRLGLYLDRYQRLLDDEYMTNLYWEYILACFTHNLPEDLSKLGGREDMRGKVREYGKKEKLPPATDDIIERITGIASYKWTQEGKAEADKQLDASSKRVLEYESMVNSNTKRKNVFKKEVGELI